MEDYEEKRAKFREEYFILGQLMTNLRRCNPEVINKIRKQENKAVLVGKEYDEWKERYARAVEKYESMMKYMEETYGDLTEEEKKYLL